MSAAERTPGIEPGTCRSCKAPIIFGETTRGRPMPLDAIPVADGEWIVSDAGRLEHVGKGPLLFPAPRYRTHFATCPTADQHRASR